MKLIKRMLIMLITISILAAHPCTNIFANDYIIDETTALIVWESCSDDIRKTLSYEYLAYACGIDPYEFSYFSRVVQAESNGTTDWSDFEDKVLIAAVIFNRVESPSFRNTIGGVLDEPGQFSTTSNGWCSSSSSQSSRWAIVEAQRRLCNGEIPNNLLYFNCIGYNCGTPYGCYGGNYFMMYP